MLNMTMMTAPGQPAYEAWQAGCTCSWLRGYGVARPLEEWREVALKRDPECTYRHQGEDFAGRVA